MAVRAPELAVSRHPRGEARWVHVSGPANITLEVQAPYVAAAEARRWAREDGARRAVRISSGGTYGPDTFEVRVCYMFTD